MLAGGAASRLGGRPKGLLDLGGRTILDGLIDLLTETTGTPPFLVANAPEARGQGPALPRPQAGGLAAAQGVASSTA